MKGTRQLESSLLNQSNYGWLRSRHLQNDFIVEEGLDELKPILQKVLQELLTLPTYINFTVNLLNLELKCVFVNVGRYITT